MIILGKVELIEDLSNILLISFFFIGKKYIVQLKVFFTKQNEFTQMRSDGLIVCFTTGKQNKLLIY